MDIEIIGLVQNAIDATGQSSGPRLTVRVSDGSRGGREFATPASGCAVGEGSAGVAEVVAIFEDNGPGFDPRDLPRVFDPFFTTKPVGKGVGLGLAISYGIVERHRGSLVAANRPQGGASITLRLPAGSDP